MRKQSMKKSGGVSFPALEVLEGRQLLSASAVTPTLGVVLYEEKGVKFTADLGTFATTAAAAALNVSIDWGDGKQSAGKLKAEGTTNTGTTVYEVVGTHKYKAAKDYAIDVSVVEPGPPPTTYEQLIASFNDMAIVSSANTALNGSVSGTYKAAPSSALGAEYLFDGTGTVSDLGAVSATGELTLPSASSETATATGTLTLTAISASSVDSGSLTLKLIGPTEAEGGGIPSTLAFEITGGTGAFKGATGGGTIEVILNSDGTGTFTFDISSEVTPIPV